MPPTIHVHGTSGDTYNICITSDASWLWFIFLIYFGNILWYHAKICTGIKKSYSKQIMQKNILFMLFMFTLLSFILQTMIIRWLETLALSFSLTTSRNQFWKSPKFSSATSPHVCHSISKFCKIRSRQPMSLKMGPDDPSSGFPVPLTN